MSISQKIRDSVALLSGVITEDSSSGGAEIAKSTAQALHVYLTSLIAGENQPLQLMETSLPGDYLNGAAVTTGVDINLGSPGAAGNKLYGIAIFNNSGSPFTACIIKDGSTTINFLTLGMTTLATGSFGLWTPPSGVMTSKNGSWKLNITCAGTMANIAYGAWIAQ
jgi:hypothetical protein